MKLKCLTLLALLACLGPRPVSAKDVVAGVVISLQGKPRIKRPASRAPYALRMNQFVYEGDQIITGEGERAAIAFMGGSEFRIDQNSAFTVDSGGGQKPAQLSTVIGKAWTRLLHGKTTGLRVKTPSAVAAVRGTEADVESGERTTVKVYEGFVDVSNAHGTQSLKAGQMTQASAGSAPEAPKDMNDKDRGTWQDSVKVDGWEKQLSRLEHEAEKRRSLELKTKDGKTIKLEIEKK